MYEQVAMAASYCAMHIAGLVADAAGTPISIEPAPSGYNKLLDHGQSSREPISQ